jgi:hypothetical protein
MSSYSEYLNRQKQRLPKILDTRPHRDAGHHTEIVKRLAASGVLETATAVGSCVAVLDAPTTQKSLTGENGFRQNYSGGHSVQDTSTYNAYTAGQAVAQSAKADTKTSQISLVCYSSTAVPEINDRLAADRQLAAVQLAKNQYARGYSTSACCDVCGKPPTYASGCNCVLTRDQRAALKSTVPPARHTIIPNVNVA